VYSVNSGRGREREWSREEMQWNVMQLML